MAMLDQKNGKDRKHTRGQTPKYAKMPRSGRVIIDAAKLRYHRHTRIMTREELAKAARMSVYSVISYELGRQFPREPAFRRLITALGVGPEDLLFDDCRYVRAEEDSE